MITSSQNREEPPMYKLLSEAENIVTSQGQIINNSPIGTAKPWEIGVSFLVLGVIVLLFAVVIFGIFRGINHP